MQIIEKSNINFGMAFRSPKAQDMPYFKKYLANSNGKIDLQALGEFVHKQSKNTKVDMCYKHTNNGDFFEIFPNNNSQNIVTVQCKEKASEQFKNKKKFDIIDSLKNFFNPKSSWDNLPEDMKLAGQLADDMEKQL